MTEPQPCVYGKHHDKVYIFIPADTEKRCLCKCTTCCFEASRCLELEEKDSNGETTSS
jgi:hypothetical protein